MKFPIPERSDLDMMSPPSRGAWIEIPNVPLGVGVPGVAPLAGGVD